MIELAQQLALPAIPGARTDGADIGHGQHDKQAQHFGRLHRLDEIAHGLGIGNVAALGHIAHQQMVLHQPGHILGFAGRKPQARTQRARDLGADIGMIARQAFGDVVQQHGAIKRFARLDALDDLGRERVIVLVFAALDGGNIADGADQMLVHRVVVIHVELHQRDDASEFRHEGAEARRPR